MQSNLDSFFQQRQLLAAVMRLWSIARRILLEFCKGMNLKQLEERNRLS